MLSKDQRGLMNPLVIPFVIAVVAMIGLGVFGTWSYLQYTDHRDNVDQKISEAVSEAQTIQKDQLEQEFEEREKEPYKVYSGPATLGSIMITHPKTWSVYIEAANTDELFGWLHPVLVSSDREKVADAVRFSVENREYASEVDRFSRKIEKGEVTSSAVTISGVDGVRFDGLIENDLNGAIILLPLRDKTFSIWTESTQFLPDFNNIIVPNLSFSP